MPTLHPVLLLSLTAVVLAPWIHGAEPAPGRIIDQLVFGIPVAEQAHGVEAIASEVVTGGLGATARRLLPLTPAQWQGGSVFFTLAVDPVEPTYATVRYWGSEGSPDRLFLFCEGKQVGYRHLGDVDILDVGSHEPPCNGRFYYVTTPLPTALTAGRTSLRCEIRANGPIWGYGDTFERYQKPMTEPTRGIYAIATHTGGCFVPPENEPQGHAPLDPPVRSAPGPEVLGQLKARIDKEISGLIAGRNPLNQVQIHFLAKSWHASWSVAHGNPQVLERIVAGIDALAAAFRSDPTKVRSDQAVYNSDWFATGMAADATRLLAAPLAPYLDRPLPGQAGLTRRAAWSAMFQDSRDWLRRHRRLYTNQSMIVDLNLYRCNRAVVALDPAKALPETQALRYLRESVGLDPWLGSDTDGGSEKPMGDAYFQLTGKGLTKELGFVGYYGEVIDWVAQIYDATRAPGQPGDPAIRERLVKVAEARAVFRYPMLDAAGNRAMRIEAVVGWRDDHYPGNVTYAERSTWDASPLYAAAATCDESDIGACQQMLADNQFFSSVAEQMTNNGLRVTAGLLGVPEQYDQVRAQPPSAKRLPMSPGQPDFVFSDEEDGVIAVKHGDEILYASLYWRARHAVNNLARIHHITPAFDRIAVVRQQSEFAPSGATWKRPDWTDFGFANGGHRYPVELHSALAGEELPIAQVPAFVAFKPGDENPYAGRADFYRCRYGAYLIGMNATAGKSFTLALPPDIKHARDLVSGQEVTADTPLTIAPRTTAVLVLQP